MVAQLSGTSRYMDQDIVDKCAQIIFRLFSMDEFNLVLEAEKSMRDSYFASMENLNKYARIN